MGGVAGRLRRASLKDVVEAVARVLPVLGDVVRGRQDRIEDDAADALGVITHESLREVAAIRSRQDIPHADAEHFAKIGEIGRALARIVGAEVGAGRGELAVAGLGRGQMGALGRLGIEAQAEKLSGEVVVSRAGERGLREHRAALAHPIDVPVADEIGGDQRVDLQGHNVARPAGEVDDGIGLLLLRACRVFRDQELDGAAVRLLAILAHDEIEAARFGELVGPRHFRARRRLDARHNSLGGLCAHRNE